MTWFDHWPVAQTPLPRRGLKTLYPRLCPHCRQPLRTFGAPPWPRDLRWCRNCEVTVAYLQD